MAPCFSRSSVQAGLAETQILSPGSRLGPKAEPALCGLGALPLTCDATSGAEGLGTGDPGGALTVITSFPAGEPWGS